MSLAEQVRRVRERIEDSRRRAGRDDEVTLVAVTKGRAPEVIRELLAAGVADIGENRVQEARAKWPDLAGAFAAGTVRRHMIGHLQRNKVGLALDLFDVVQSVDSVPLARKISDLAGEVGRRVPVLLQVNAGGEDQKHGFRGDGIVERAVGEISALPAIEVAGLMTLAPLAAKPPELRALFGGMRRSFERLRGLFPEVGLRHLSMGMSQDFEIAVEEGATMVRIGSALFISS